MADVSLVPQSHVLEGGQHVGSYDAGLAAETLGDDGVALVRHSRRALLAGCEILFRLQHLGALVVTHLQGDLLDGGGQQGQGGHELGMTVALHHLRGDGSRSQIEHGHGDALHLRVDVGVVAHRTGDLAHRDLLYRPL